MSPLVPSLAGGLVVSGILGIIVGLRPTAPPPRAKAPARSRRFNMPARTRMLLLAGVGLGLVGWVITGWVLALVIAPMAVIGLPALLSAPPAATQIARLEAMEEWTRSLAGVLTVGIGLEQALVATLRSTPVPINTEVTRLVARLRARWDTEAALRSFADELDDATGDLLPRTSFSAHAVAVPALPACWKDSPSRPQPTYERVVRWRPIGPSRARQPGG